MTLIKTSLLNGIAVLVKLLTLLGINKVLAVYVGPGGYAALGQFQNAMTMATSFASGAINMGVVKYTAEYHDREAEQHIVWRTAGTIVLVGSLLVAVIVTIFNKSLAEYFLHDVSYGDVFVWFAATLIFFTFNSLLLAIINGKKEITIYVIANIAGSLCALCVTYVMVVQFGLRGALVSLAIYQSISFFVTLSVCRRASWFRLSYLFGAVDRKTALNLSKFTFMALVSAICDPLSQLFIRHKLSGDLGLESAGCWEAMWRLSAAYLTFGTTIISVYFLPKFSETLSYKLLKKEVYDGLLLIMPVTMICCFFVFVSRDPIIELLFTNEFSEMRVLFSYQMVGDFFKMASWLIAFVFVCKIKLKLYIFIQLFFSIVFVGLTYIFLPFLGFEGVALAHALNYFLCFLFVLYFLNRQSMWN